MKNASSNFYYINFFITCKPEMFNILPFDMEKSLHIKLKNNPAQSDAVIGVLDKNMILVW